MKNTLIITVFAACGLMGSAQPTFVDTTASNRNAVIEHFYFKDMGIDQTDPVINRLISEKQGRVFGITIFYYEHYTIFPFTIFKDFSCEDGLLFSNYFDPWHSVGDIDGPLGMINRGNVEYVQQWENRVNNILTQPSCLNVAAKGNIDWNL